MLLLWFCTSLGTGNTNDMHGRGGGPSASWPFPSPAVTITEQSRNDQKAFCKFMQKGSKDMDDNRH